MHICVGKRASVKVGHFSQVADFVLNRFGLLFQNAGEALLRLAQTLGRCLWRLVWNKFFDGSAELLRCHLLKVQLRHVNDNLSLRLLL